MLYLPSSSIKIYCCVYWNLLSDNEPARRVGHLIRCWKLSSTSKQDIKGTCFFKGGILENIEMKRRWNGGYADIEEGSFTNSLTDWFDVFTFIPSWHFLWWCCITDFLELAVQFGMVTMFASAYPLIASFALVVSNYILQLELDLWIQLWWYTLHNKFKTLDCSEISWNSQVLTSEN